MGPALLRVADTRTHTSRWRSDGLGVDSLMSGTETLDLSDRCSGLELAFPAAARFLGMRRGRLSQSP